MTPYRDRRHAGHYDPTSADYFGTIGTSTSEDLARPAEPEPELKSDPEYDAEPPAEDEGDDPRATRKAIELAAAHGIDLASITGSGLHGRITVGDVDAALADNADLEDTDAAGGF